MPEESKFGLDDVLFDNDSCLDGSEVNQLCSFTSILLCDYIFKGSDFIHVWKPYIPNVLFPTEAKANEAPLPILDHTTEADGSGYIYFNSTGAQTNDWTIARRLKSYAPLLNGGDATRCLEFYYFLSGKDSIALNVLTNTSLGTEHLIWTRDYDHGATSWWKGNVNIKLLIDYHVLFKAVVGDNPNDGLVALDDIILRNGPCSR